MCKPTKNLTIQGGLLDFQDSGGGFDKGEREIQEGVETPVGPMGKISILGTTSQLPSLTPKTTTFNVKVYI